MNNPYGNLFNTINANPKFEIKNSSDNQFYFVLKAANGQILVTSETYTTKQNCQSGIESVKKIAAKASVVDNT